MPDAVEGGRVGLGQAEPARREQAVQDAAVQAVDVGPRQRARAHLVHGRLVAGAPVVGEGGPVLRRQGEPLLQQLPLADDAAAPVDDGAEDVEAQRLHGAEPGLHLAVPLGWLSSTFTVKVPARISFSRLATRSSVALGTLLAKVPSGLSSLPLDFIIENRP